MHAISGSGPWPLYNLYTPTLHVNVQHTTQLNNYYDAEDKNYIHINF